MFHQKYLYFLRQRTINRILTISDRSSEASQDAHKPSGPMMAIMPYMHAIRITKVRNTDRIADTVPLEKAVKRPEAKILKPTTRHAGAAYRRQRQASS